MKSNRWWFVWETEYPEGSHLVNASTAKAAKKKLRSSLDDGQDNEALELTVAPANDLDELEAWIRSDDGVPARP